MFGGIASGAIWGEKFGQFLGPVADRCPKKVVVEHKQLGSCDVQFDSFQCIGSFELIILNVLNFANIQSFDTFCKIGHQL